MANETKATVQNIGRNVAVSQEGNFLVIRIDTNQPGQASASGKSNVIASTVGNQSVAAGGVVMSLGLNLYTKV